MRAEPSSLTSIAPADHSDVAPVQREEVAAGVPGHATDAHRRPERREVTRDGDIAEPLGEGRFRPEAALRYSS